MYGVRGGHRMLSKAYPSVFIWYSIFTFLLVVLRLDGKSIHRLFKTFDVENRFSF